MKQLFTILAAVLLTASVFAQSPEKMTYQAVVRDVNQSLITNQAVGMQISILQGSATGTVVYSETQTPTTNINGLLSIEIGGGPGFDVIDWANGPYYIKTEIDPTGGTNYSITGTSQLLSVPYALFAKTADSISGTIVETDPIFGASIAADITQTDTTYWNNKLDIEIDGDSTNELQTLSLYNDSIIFLSDGGFVVLPEETDPIFGASVASGITGTDTTNWNNKLDAEVDGSITNEIQTISRTGLTVTLSDGGGTFQDSVNVYTAGTGIDITGNVISTTGTDLAIGDSYGGGIVFWVDASGQHGLIAATADQSIGIQWYNGASKYTGTTGDGLYAGAMNTAMIVATQMADNQTGNFAAKVCADYSVTVGGITYGDWYLPSKYELNLMHEEKATIGGFAIAYYWSSTELNSSHALLQNFYNGQQTNYGKAITHRVRAVRAF